MTNTFSPVDISQLKLKQAPTGKQPVPAGRDLPHKLREQILSVPGVQGYGFGTDELVVYIDASTDLNHIPETLDGLTVRTEVVGTLSAF